MWLTLGGSLGVVIGMMFSISVKLLKFKFLDGVGATMEVWLTGVDAVEEVDRLSSDISPNISSDRLW